MDDKNLDYKFSFIAPCNHNRYNNETSIIYNSRDGYNLYAHLEVKYYHNYMTQKWYKRSLVKCMLCSCNHVLTKQLQESKLVEIQEPPIGLTLDDYLFDIK